MMGSMAEYDILISKLFLHNTSKVLIQSSLVEKHVY